MKWVWVVVGLSALGAGCSSSNSSTAPDTSGRVELTVSPTAVGYAGGAGVGGAICRVPYISRWGPFTWTLRETNGAPVTITSFTYSTFTNAGVQLSSDEIISATSRDFTGTAAPTIRIPANGTITSRVVYDCELETNGVPNFGGGRAVSTVSGTDDSGAAVSSTATLTVLPPT